MLMCVQMILTELIISVTLRAVTEYKIISVFFRSSAYRTLVLGSPCRRRCFHILLIRISAMYFLRSKALHIPCSEVEQNKIEHRHYNADSRSPYKL